jgi:hypothetical protein
MELIELQIGSRPDGTPVWMSTRKENADFYGWSKHFEPYIEGLQIDPSTGVQILLNPRLKKGRARKGKRITISRTPMKSGRLAGYTNIFRISDNATAFHLAEVAKLTDCDWYWMTTDSGHKRSREEWLAVHELTIQ